MRNFVFHNPTKVLFGRNTITAIGPETAFFGRKALLVYGRASIKANTTYQQVTESLHQAGLEIIEHGGVQSNPVLSHVNQGIAKAKQHGVDAVVAVGGGSVIDSAKAITAGALVNHSVWLFFTGKKSVQQVLPLTCVLTLAASGSEMNSGMVLTNEDKQAKFGFAHRLLYPKVSILDPVATFTVPPDYTAYGAVDAIAHVLEMYCTTRDPDTSVQDCLMEGLIRNVMDSCDRILTDPEDYDARAAMMWAATLALNGLTGAGLGKVGFPMHLIEHAISALYAVPHGAGLSVVIPAWMMHELERRQERFAQLTRRVFGIEKIPAKATALAGIELLKAWFIKINSPTSLAEIKLTTADIPRIAANTQSQAKIWRLPQYTAPRVEAILQLCC